MRPLLDTHSTTLPSRRGTPPFAAVRALGASGMVGRPFRKNGTSLSVRALAAALRGHAIYDQPRMGETRRSYAFRTGARRGAPGLRVARNAYGHAPLVDI